LYEIISIPNRFYQPLLILIPTDTARGKYYLYNGLYGEAPFFTQAGVRKRLEKLHVFK